MRGIHTKAAVLLATLVLGAGCTTLRELPRSEYAARPERQRVRIKTIEGLQYEFDYIQVAGDTLTGFREGDDEGMVRTVSRLQVPLDDIRVLSVRGVDWYRSGLVGGGVLAGVIAAGLSRGRSDRGGGSSTGGGKGLPD